MPQVTTSKELCNEIYQTSTVGNINITAQNIKRSYKYHIRYKSRHEWTHLKTEILNGLEFVYVIIPSFPLIIQSTRFTGDS